MGRKQDKQAARDAAKKIDEDAAIADFVRAKIDLIELTDAINDDEGPADILIARGKAIRAAAKWLGTLAHAFAPIFVLYLLQHHHPNLWGFYLLNAALFTFLAICFGIKLVQFVFAGGFSRDRYRWIAAAKASDTVKKSEKTLTRTYNKSREEIERVFRDRITAYVTNVTELSSGQQGTDTPQNTSESIYDLRFNIRKRVERAIDEYRDSSLMNLTIGIIFFVAIAVSHTHFLDLLFPGILRLPQIRSDLFNFVQLLVSISASTFAFFFLWTYRSHSNDAKFFRNELTSIDMKLLGVLQAKEAAEASGASNETRQQYLQILGDLARTERHLLLNFGQKSVYDEVAKTERLFWRMGLQRRGEKP